MMSPRVFDIPALRRDMLNPDPIAQFERWRERAVVDVPLCDAMALATVDSHGLPDTRMVLLKGHGPEGFRFFTSRESAKADQLATTASAALVIYWRELDRQVRVRGQVERLPDAECDNYFATRPRDSQLGAWASPQSHPLATRAELEARVREYATHFDGQLVPRPPHWGGYVLLPGVIEFWQGLRGPLQDRFRYTREPAGWAIERLAP